MNIKCARKKIKQFMKKQLKSNNSWFCEAARYSVLNTGHLYRPLTLVATAKAYKVSERVSIPLAAGVEYAHVTSLILDDMPSMDNSLYRRYKPSCFRVFGEAETTLCALYLLELFNQNIANSQTSDKQKIEILDEKSSCLSTLVRGQEIDLYEQRKIPKPESVLVNIEGKSELIIRPEIQVELKKIPKPEIFLLDPLKIESLEGIRKYYEEKTGALYGSSAVMGGILGNASPQDLYYLRQFGLSLGLSYQLKDDLGDREKAENFDGKPTGQDAQKVTPIDVVGVEKTKGLQAIFAKQARGFLKELKADVSHLENILDEMDLER